MSECASATLWSDDMGCQVGVETAKLTTVMNTNETKTTKSYDTIKLGIDAHSKWYYVARQLDGATPQPVQKMELDQIMTKLK
jgi:lipid-binding SYLF domain-containing protein